MYVSTGCMKKGEKTEKKKENNYDQQHEQQTNKQQIIHIHILFNI